MSGPHISVIGAWEVSQAEVKHFRKPKGTETKWGLENKAYKEATEGTGAVQSGEGEAEE